MRSRGAWWGALLLGVGATATLVTSGAVQASARKVNISFYYPVGVAGPLAKIMDTLVSEFNRFHPGIHVTASFAGNYPETLAKVETLIESGTPPDTGVVNATAMFDLLHLHAIKPVDNLVKAGDFYPAFLTNAYFDGHYWSVPFQRSTVVLYYNKKEFAAAHISGPPQTWDQLLSDAKKLTHKGQWGIELPSSGTNYWVFAPFVLESGKNLMNAAGTKVYFNAPRTIEALSFWRKLQLEKVMPPGVISWSTVPTDFIQGHAAMIIHSSGSLTSIVGGAHFPVGVTFMPKNVRYGVDVGGGDFYVFRGIDARHEAASIKFIQWMTSPAVAAQWSIDTGYVGVTPRAYSTPVMKKFMKAHPQYATSPDQLKYAHRELATYDLNRIYDILDSAVQATMDGQQTPRAALDAAQKEAIRALASYQK